MPLEIEEILQNINPDKPKKKRAKKSKKERAKSLEHALNEPQPLLSDFLELIHLDNKPKIEAVRGRKKTKKEELVRPRRHRKKISDLLQQSLPETDLPPQILEVGEVTYIGDGVCKVAGLSNARIDDVLRVETESGDVMTLVLGISVDLVESVVLGDYFVIKKGNLVFSTQQTLKIPSGYKALGRVMSPIGEPMDGKGPIESEKDMQVERPAPAVFMRSPIKDQVRTGFLVIDSIIPVGKGQRELVTGDRKTGKTRLMADILCNLKNTDIFCVYVTIGAQKAKVKAFSQYLEKNGALQKTTIVMGSSDDPPSLNYLAPYTGSAVAEFFCDLGKDVLVVYDDLSKHAKAYRQLSLLLKRSPGRDAYPGDIFYLHSRLLERSAKLSEKYGNGSITALPMCETQNGDVSEYITTNLMSITDGHIYLDSQMMHDGVLPAVNSGTSVSRIGGGVQPPILRKLGGMAGGSLARYNEVKSYETMNTEITEETEREINRGKRTLEIFSQRSGLSFTATEESILLYAVTQGYLDYIPLEQVIALKAELIDFFRKKSEQFKKLSEVCEDMKAKTSDENFALIDEMLETYFTRVKSEPAKLLWAEVNKYNKKKAEELEKKKQASVGDSEEAKKDEKKEVTGGELNQDPSKVDKSTAKGESGAASQSGANQEAKNIPESKPSDKDESGVNSDQNSNKEPDKSNEVTTKTAEKGDISSNNEEDKIREKPLK